MVPTFRFLSLDSTNLEAIRFAQKPGFSGLAPLKSEGEFSETSFLFTADYQTAGRGQRGHVWTAPWGGLYASFLYPIYEAGKTADDAGKTADDAGKTADDAGKTTDERRVSLSAGQISLLSAWTAFQTIRNILCRYRIGGVACLPLETGLEIRWPNDIYYNQRKIAGILTESACPGWLVTGIGINVNADLPDCNLSNPDFCPIGIKQILNRKVELDAVLQVLVDYWQNSIRLARQNPILLAQNVESRLAFIGQSVLLGQPERPVIPPISGTFLGIDNQGFARLQTSSGERRFSSGRIRPD